MQTLTLRVADLAGEVCPMQIAAGATLRDVKMRLADRLEAPWWELALTRGAEAWSLDSDGATLSELGIDGGSELLCVRRGAWEESPSWFRLSALEREEKMYCTPSFVVRISGVGRRDVQVAARFDASSSYSLPVVNEIFVDTHSDDNTSLLLRLPASPLGRNRYVSVARRAYAFETLQDDPVLRYFCPCDFFYPVALGAAHVYFLADARRVARQEFQEPGGSGSLDAWGDALRRQVWRERATAFEEIHVAG